MLAFADCQGRCHRRAVSTFMLWWAVALTAESVLPVARADTEPGNAYASLTAGFKEGDFGTSIDNQLYSLTPEIGYVSQRYDMFMSIPLYHLNVTGNGISSSQSGLGDVALGAGRRLWADEPAVTSLYGRLNLKLATGDENKGLGTGGTDVGVSLSAERKIGAYALTALAGYTRVGEPSGINYDNTVSYGFGINRRFTRSNLFASLLGQTSAIPGGDVPLEFNVGFFSMLSLDYVIIANTFVGLSDGSPDDGIEIGMVRWFR